MKLHLMLPTCLVDDGYKCIQESLYHTIIYTINQTHPMLNQDGWLTHVISTQQIAYCDNSSAIFLQGFSWSTISLGFFARSTLIKYRFCQHCVSGSSWTITEQKSRSSIERRKSSSRGRKRESKLLWSILIPLSFLSQTVAGKAF